MTSVALLILGSSGLLVDTAWLRGPSASTTTPATVHDGVKFEVLDKTSIGKKSTVDCLCKMGTFWHWRIKSCVKQGGPLYECGFFPAEHHNMTCQDGLKCVALDTDVKYTHPGAKPASCRSCTPADQCLTGEQRHEKNCLKEYLLSGSACQTVRIQVLATATAKATEEVTESSTASATSTATSSQKAIAKHDGETASATKEATATGEAKVKAEASGKASAKAKATEKGVAEGKACVSLEEVKKLLGLGKLKRMGAVLSAKVVARGDAEAFDKAHGKALKAALEAGLLNAQEAAKALAEAKARQHAGLEAEAKAEEEAAWMAEAGAEKDAQDNARAEALAKAESAAKSSAEDAAKAAQAAKKEASEKATDAAKAKADEAERAAAEAKARADAIADVVNPKPTQAPVRPTTPEPTSPPRKITPDQIAAKLP